MKFETPKLLIHLNPNTRSFSMLSIVANKYLIQTRVYRASLVSMCLLFLFVLYIYVVLLIIHSTCLSFLAVNWISCHSIFYMQVTLIELYFCTGRPKYKGLNFPFWLLPVIVLTVFTLQTEIMIEHNLFNLVCDIVNPFLCIFIMRK